MTIDLTKFCAVRDIRTYLNQPFTINGVGRVACNGWAAIVLLEDVETSNGISAKLCDKFTEWKNNIPNRKKGRTLASMDLPEKKPCDLCYGSGFTPLMVDCPECDGNGSFEHGNHTYDCKECDGGGAVRSHKGGVEKCNNCNGSGEGFQLIRIDHQYFNAALARLFVDLPKAAMHTAADPLGTAYITFDGGWGALMPCRQ